MQHYIFITEAMSKSHISRKRARTHENKKQKQQQQKRNVLGHGKVREDRYTFVHILPFICILPTKK